MTIRSRKGVMFLGVAAVLSLGALPLVAQEPKPGPPNDGVKPPGVKRAYDPSRRVPDFFGQVGLTPEQREAMYKIRGKHLQRINELEKQVARIRSEMTSECEALLTDTQKQLLEFRRRAAARGKKESESAAGSPAASKVPAKPAN